MIWLAISCILGLISAASLFLAGAVYSHRMDWLDRLAVGGLAGSLLMTTPALFFPTPFDGWSFALSRSFLCVLLVKRFLVPVLVCYAGRKRQAQQMDRSGLRDKMEDWL